MSKFLSKYDGIKSRSIFCMWTGDEQMSANRLQALWSIYNNTCCPIIFINKKSLSNWINPEYPLHLAFPYLSSTHKSDYLRCYFMHHYGGGYTDIKLTTVNWHPFFEKIDKSYSLALGYNELPHGMPHLTGEKGKKIIKEHNKLIGLCAFIFKKNTHLTSSWLDQTNQLLDEKFELLKENPAQHHLDQFGIVLPDGSISNYPLRWAEMLGEIFHPLIYDHKDSLTHSNIAPFFGSYR